MTRPTDEPTGTARSAPERPSAVLVAAILAPALIVFVLPMVDLIEKNEAFFGGDLGAGSTVALIGVATAAIGFLLLLARRWRIGRFLLGCYLVVTPAWVVYSLVNGSHSTWSFLLLVVMVLAGGAVVGWSDRPGRVRAAAIVSVAVLVGTSVSMAVELSSRPGATTASGEGLPVAPDLPGRQLRSDLPNVYHIILDELQTEQFEAALERADASAFNGFTLYPDARTTYGRTVMSVADVFASEPYDFSVSPDEFIDGALFDPSSYLAQLRMAGYDTSSYVWSRHLYGGGNPFDHQELLSEAATSDPGQDHTDLATSAWVYANLPVRASRSLLPAHHFDQLSGGAALPEDVQALSVDAFQTFVNREGRLDGGGRYTLLHLILPHRPYIVDERCVLQDGVTTGPVEQAGCAVGLLEQMITELQSLDRFTSSTIVIHGDHGAGLERDGDQLTMVPEEHYSERWSNGRSKPLLLVKPAGVSAADPLATSDRPALLSDVMPTIFDSVGLDLAPTPTRSSLLGEEVVGERERWYYFYEMRNGDDRPDGSMSRFRVVDGGLVRDEVVPVP